jgi:hypothetical protein
VSNAAPAAGAESVLRHSMAPSQDCFRVSLLLELLLLSLLSALATIRLAYGETHALTSPVQTFIITQSDVAWSKVNKTVLRVVRTGGHNSTVGATGSPLAVCKFEEVEAEEEDEEDEEGEGVREGEGLSAYGETAAVSTSSWPDD